MLFLENLVTNVIHMKQTIKTFDQYILSYYGKVEENCVQKTIQQSENHIEQGELRTQFQLESPKVNESDYNVFDSFY